MSRIVVGFDSRDEARDTLALGRELASETSRQCAPVHLR